MKNQLTKEIVHPKLTDRHIMQLNNLPKDGLTLKHHTLNFSKSLAGPLPKTIVLHAPYATKT
jgi:hypothetical protein